MNKKSPIGCLIHENQIAKELWVKDPMCVIRTFEFKVELHPWLFVFQNTLTEETIIARRVFEHGWGWYRKLAEGKSLEEAKMKWKARNDPPSLF